MNKVLITGSSRGIGKAIALCLANSGYEIVLHGRTKNENLLNLAKELNCEYLYFDVSDTKACKEALQDREFYGVILNAGITKDGTFAALSFDEWNEVLQTNLYSFYNVLNPIIMPMARKKDGRIVVISSVSGISGNRGQSNYSASKAGLIGAAKSLAIELASRNITVNVVAPGLIQTDMIDSNLPLEKIIKLIPAGRMGQPSDIAGIVKFLLSSEASYITKQVIGVNGGLI